MLFWIIIFAFGLLVAREVFLFSAWLSENRHLEPDFRSRLRFRASGFGRRH